MTTMETGRDSGSWLETIAMILPLKHRKSTPFTLGEAIEELGLWARDARAESWRSNGNKDSLNLDIRDRYTVIGPSLRTLVSTHVKRILVAPDRLDVGGTADDFQTVWRQPDSIRAAFRDLCEAARDASTSSWELRNLSDVVASQLGPAIRSPWSALREAAAALGGGPETGLNRSPEAKTVASSLSPEDRVRAAEDILAAEPPTGHVVVWIVYDRAIVPWRIEAGPITFLWANWMVPNALRDDGQDFAERKELRALLNDVMWADDLEGAINNHGTRLALARVDLGQRPVAGALQEAERRVEAILSIAVGAGGVSWQETGASSVVADGRIWTTSRGLRLGRHSRSEDTYGMGATSEILKSVAERMNETMTERPMPEYLIEALVSLREASMTKHRDVDFYGTRAVTPRVATALEDHATELIASVASMTSPDLASALEEREVDWILQRRVLEGITALFDGNIPPSKDDGALEKEICQYQNGGRVVSIIKAVELRDQLLRLPMSDLARADLTASLRALTDPEYEIGLLESIRCEVKAVRTRHRRVRNAINHGNPLTEPALESIRGYSERCARSALNLALEGYVSGTPVSSMVIEERQHRQRQDQARSEGQSYLDRSQSSAA